MKVEDEKPSKGQWTAPARREDVGEEHRRPVASRQAMRAVYARAGDTFFTKSNTVLGRLIRWGETDKGETNGTWANHAGVVVEDGWIGEPLDTAGIALKVLGASKQAIVVEALWKTRRGPLVVNGVEVRVFRPVSAYTRDEVSRFVIAASAYVGNTYGWWKLGFQLADRQFFGGRKVLTTLLYRDDRPICSYLAAKVNQAAFSLARGIERLKTISTDAAMDATRIASASNAFGMAPQAADPDEMMDFCLEHPEWWEEIR